MEKLAIIDFCGTIANYQTLDPYLEFVLRENCPEQYYIYKFLGGKHFQLLKEKVKNQGCPVCPRDVLVKKLKGLPVERLEDCGKYYYKRRVRRNLIQETLQLISKLKLEHYRVIIVSGGLDYYIRFFAEEFGIHDVITTQLEIVAGICTGKLKASTPCMGKAKVDLLNSYMEYHRIKGKLQIGITDSWTDLPLLNQCKKKVIISKKKHQPWVTDDMEEIIWG